MVEGSLCVACHARSIEMKDRKVHHVKISNLIEPKMKVLKLYEE
jgi:hypothetical protein